MPDKKEEVKVAKPNDSIVDSKKIDLYINNQEDQEQGISIMNVFSRLKERFHIFAFVMIIGLLAGLLVPTLIYTFKDKSESAVAVIGFDYANAEEGKAPDGGELDISYLKSSYIIQNALNNVTLSKKVSTAQVQSNLVITGILTDETKQQMDILNKLEEAKNNDFGKLLQEFKKQYRPQYIISLNNNFSAGSTGVRKVTLSSDDLSHLLSAITKEYNDYFVETYQDISIPANQVAAMNVDLLDFLDILDKTRGFLTDLAEYCTNRDKLVSGFRSNDGLSFKDLSNTIVDLRDAKINDLYADIFLDNVCKDKYLLLNNYESRKQEIKIQLDTLTESINKLNYDIEHYTPDSIVIKTPGGADVGPIEVNSEYYNALVLQYMELQAEKTKLEQEQSTIDFRISKLEGADPTPEQIAAIDAKVQSVLEKADELYTMVNESSEQLFKSNAYQNRYMHSITTSERESLKDNLKLFLIGAAAGVGLGFVLWVADAFVLEFRNVKRHNDEMEAE